MNALNRLRRAAPAAMRIVAAVGGGYALAALCSVAALALPISKSQAVLVGMLVSFPVYAGAVVWAFAARTAVRAWTGLGIVALPLSAVAWSIWTGKVFS